MDFLKRHYRPLYAAGAGALLAVVVLLTPVVARAGLFENTIMLLLANIAYVLIQFLAKFLVVIINIMIAVAQYNTFLGAPAVEKGWVIVRDLSNMFFIVVLLIIAFGTILKLENYRYNRLLARLIVMAVLVNFSKFIAGFFIDFSQVIMLTFVSAWKDAAAGNITSALGLTEIIQIPKDQNLGDVTNVGPVLTAMLLGLFLIIVAGIVMSIVAIVLIFRILALWFLIVLSPLAYLFRTYPATEKYAARWWQEFGRYVIVGPVMAFLLWLSLAIMAQGGHIQFANSVFLNVNPKEGTQLVTGIGSERDTAGRISAAISTIGSSENLLGYITSILLLIGTLVITKEIGVAGGNMAGQWAERIRGFATKAATVGGATAAAGWLGLGAVTAGRPTLKTIGRVGGAAGRGIGNALIDRAQVALGGIPLRPSAWREGWKKAQERKRHDWEIKRVQASMRMMTGSTRMATERKFTGFQRGEGLLGFIPRPTFATKEVEKEIKPRFLWGAAGSPEYFAYQVATAANLGKMFTGRAGEVTGAEYYKQNVEYQRLIEQGKAMEDELKISKASRDLGKYYIDETFKRSFESRLNQKIQEIDQRRQNPNDDNNFQIEYDEKGRERSRRSYDKVLKEQLKAEGFNPAATDAETNERRQKFRDDWNRERTTAALNKEEQQRQVTFRAQEIARLRQDPRSPYNQRSKIDKEGKVTGTETFSEAFVEAQRQGKTLFEFENDWNRDLAERELEKEPNFINPIEAMKEQDRQRIEATTTEAQRRAEGFRLMKDQSDKLKAKANSIEAGGLTDKQQDRISKEIKNLDKRLAQIDQDILQHPQNSAEYRRLDALRDEFKKQKDYLSRYMAGNLTTKEKESDPYKKDRTEAAEVEKNLHKDAARVDKALSQTVTESDVRLLEDQIKQQQRRIQDQAKEVTRLRPAVPQELRRQLRSSIAEKKKEITSDSWQEHLAVLQDAIRKHDVSLAAAALERATEYANENEILNAFGYDSDAQGLKKFMENVFQKQMGVSEDQALAIATDISYKAEGQRHWGVARATRVDAATGRQVWQSEEERSKEVLAEIRKQDFEDFTRRANRLAWGKEIVGKDELPETATPEERAAFFRAGGGRQFVMSPYAQAYLAENFAKTVRNLGQGRFNVNLAVKLMSDSNKEEMQKILAFLGEQRFEGERGKFHSFKEFMEILGNFASKRQERGEFELVERFLEQMK